VTERPILFSSPMVRAIMDGTKTQTRRVVKVTGPNRDRRMITSPHEKIVRFKDGAYHYRGTTAISGPHPCPYGRAGDSLWVRETFMRADNSVEIFYNADWPNPSGVKWKPSIHMPRAASRITLRITDVRVERLQDISAGDIVDEGYQGPGYWVPRGGARYEDGCDGVHWYRELWESINGEGSWAVNPWVWVVGFAPQRGTAT
jgi:hypothetical protein